MQSEKPSPEEFMQTVMTSMPEDQYPVVSEPQGKRKKKNDVVINPEPEGENLPVLCEEPAGDDLTLRNMLVEGVSARTVYSRVLEEIAEEAAHLKSLRVAAEAMGIPFSKISRDRVSTLKELADILEKKVKEEAVTGGNTGGKVDFQSENFQRVIKWILAKMNEAAKDALIPDHSIKLLFAGWQQRMHGFAELAEEIYYGDDSSLTKKRKARGTVEL
jgi:molybdenum-dependent DNA-binding transcriptional regulator ModE